MGVQIVPLAPGKAMHKQFFSKSEHSSAVKAEIAVLKLSSTPKTKTGKIINFIFISHKDNIFLNLSKILKILL